jgi:hypothetical protein
MKHKNKQNWVLVLFASVAMVFMSPVWAEDIESKSANVKYEKQTTLTCNKQEFQIPPYFPFGDKFSRKDGKQLYDNKPFPVDLYLTAQENECTPDYFNIVLGLGPYCSGAHICIDSSFAYSKVGTNILENMDGALLLNLKEVELDKNKNGYFVPSQCHVYCSTAKLIWFDYDKLRIFIISTKNPGNDKKVIGELVKSANSYINNQK